MKRRWTRPFRLLLSAQTVSRFGDGVDQVAFGWIAFDQTGSVGLLGWLLAAGAVPNLVLAPWAGVLADRWAKKPLVVAAAVGRGTLVAAAAVLLACGALSVPLLFALVVANSVFETLGGPAASALTAHVVEPDRLADAGGLTVTWTTSAQMAGLALAGGVIAGFGVAGGVALDAATFFVAAGLTSLARIPTDRPAEGRSAAAGSAGWTDLTQGLRYLASHRPLLLAAALALAANFALAPVNVLEVPLVRTVLGGGPDLVALVGLALAGGMIAGGRAVGPAVRRWGTWPTVLTGFFGLGAGCLGLAGAGWLAAGWAAVPTALGAYAVLGFLVPLVTAPLGAWLSGQVPLDRQGRVFSVVNTLALAAAPLGAALAGTFAGWLPIPLIYLGTGVGLLAVTGGLVRANLIGWDHGRNPLPDRRGCDPDLRGPASPEDAPGADSARTPDQRRSGPGSGRNGGETTLPPEVSGGGGLGRAGP